MGESVTVVKKFDEKNKHNCFQAISKSFEIVVNQKCLLFSFRIKNKSLDFYKRLFCFVKEHVFNKNGI